MVQHIFLQPFSPAPAELRENRRWFVYEDAGFLEIQFLCWIRLHHHTSFMFTSLLEQHIIHGVIYTYIHACAAFIEKLSLRRLRNESIHAVVPVRLHNIQIDVSRPVTTGSIIGAKATHGILVFDPSAYQCLLK